MIVPGFILLLLLLLPACVYEPPPEVVLVPPETGVFFEGDPVLLEFSQPIDPASLSITVWPDNRTIELELEEGTVPRMRACTVSTSPCGTTSMVVADDGMSATLTMDPDDLGEPDVPLILEVESGLTSAVNGADTGTGLFFDFQFKPLEPTAEPIPFQDGNYTILAVIEEPVPTIMNLLAHLVLSDDPTQNRVAVAGAEADIVDDKPANTNVPEDLYVDVTDQGFVIFALASLRLSPEGERFFETDPFELELSLGPIVATVINTRLTGKVTTDPETGDDRIDGTMSYDEISIDAGNGPFSYPAGTTIFEAVYAAPERMPEGTPDICTDLCGAATSQCFPPEGFPGAGFCGIPLEEQ